jgi:hypothetical protein
LINQFCNKEEEEKEILTCAAAFAKLSKARVIAAVLIVSVLILQSI